MAAQMGSEGLPGGEQGSKGGAVHPPDSPSLRGVDSSQLPTQLNDHPQPDDADSNEVTVFHMSRKQLAGTGVSLRATTACTAQARMLEPVLQRHD